MLSVPKKENMPKSQFKAKHKGEKSKSQYKQCVPPCVRYLCTGDKSAFTEAERQQRSWGSQRDLKERSETSSSLTPSSPVRSDDRSPILEVRQADTSFRAAATAFLLSSSEEVDIGNAW